MKLISNKYLVALSLAIVVLVTTVSYMSYDVIITQPVVKTPQQIIDSLESELNTRDSIIQRLNDQHDKNPKIGVPTSVIETKTSVLVNRVSDMKVKKDHAQPPPVKQYKKSDADPSVFVGF